MEHVLGKLVSSTFEKKELSLIHHLVFSPGKFAFENFNTS